MPCRLSWILWILDLKSHEYVSGLSASLMTFMSRVQQGPWIPQAMGKCNSKIRYSCQLKMKVPNSLLSNSAPKHRLTPSSKLFYDKLRSNGQTLVPTHHVQKSSKLRAADAQCAYSRIKTTSCSANKRKRSHHLVSHFRSAPLSNKLASTPTPIYQPNHLKM